MYEIRNSREYVKNFIVSEEMLLILNMKINIRIAYNVVSRLKFI